MSEHNAVRCISRGGGRIARRILNLC